MLLMKSLPSSSGVENAFLSSLYLDSAATPAVSIDVSGETTVSAAMSMLYVCSVCCSGMWFTMVYGMFHLGFCEEFEVWKSE